MKRWTREPNREPDADFDHEIMTLREVANYLNCQVCRIRTAGEPERRPIIPKASLNSLPYWTRICRLEWSCPLLKPCHAAALALVGRSGGRFTLG